LKDTEHLIFGDLRYLPEPEHLTADIPLILINPTQAAKQRVDNQGNASRITTAWDVVLVHKFDVSRPFETHIEQTEILHTLLNIAAPKVQNWKLYDENKRGIGHIELVDVAAPVYSPPENELMRHDARFWNAIVVSTIQVATTVVVMNIPDAKNP
jgi:hypothetical protein